VQLLIRYSLVHENLSRLTGAHRVHILWNWIWVILHVDKMAVVAMVIVGDYGVVQLRMQPVRWRPQPKFSSRRDNCRAVSGPGGSRHIRVLSVRMRNVWIFFFLFVFIIIFWSRSQANKWPVSTSRLYTSSRLFNGRSNLRLPTDRQWRNFLIIQCLPPY